MKDKDEIMRQLHIWYEEYDTLPLGHPVRLTILDKINVLRWVLNMKRVQTHPGGQLVI